MITGCIGLTSSQCLEEFTDVHSFHIMITEKAVVDGETLWQDCLALLIMEPEQVRQMLIDNFGGVRFDGTNATIIGSKQGEFIADRNNITRVWMDHGAWPYLTTELYMQQTGDVEFLVEENSYFKDPQVCRGEEKDMMLERRTGQQTA